ncbi:flavodoxin [Sphingobacterium endophyticum]|uniref:flavodoxin n=1 Tax=Sphingobacterium endophyticum TaxID=2546448 RepID=UPI0018CDF35F|nr:flavodoxin [Sphingobacterium endophyticum]
MKKILHLFILLFITGSQVFACKSDPKIIESPTENEEINAERIAVVYLSRTNNTKVLAEMIHEVVGGDLIALETLNPYPTDYKQIVEQVASENNRNYLPPIKTKIDLSQYDRIYLGFPTWGMQLPPPMKSFLNNYDWKGKVIVPFNSNAGYGLGSCLEDLKIYAKGAKILEVFSTKGGIERDGIKLAIEGKRKMKVDKSLKEWLIKVK